MVRDPQWLHAYWEISSADRHSHRIGAEGGGPILVLRLFDCSETVSPRRPRRSIDVTLAGDATRWNVAVPLGVSRWQGELGYIGSRGEFVSLCQSNAVRMPTLPQIPDENVAQPAVAGAPEIHAEQQPPGLWPEQRPAVQPVGSRELQRPREAAPPSSAAVSVLGGASEQFAAPPSLASEQWMVPPGVSSEQLPALPPGVSSEQLPLAAAAPAIAGAEAPQAVAPGRGKPFWLEVHTELIVYGATEPDAKVTVMGEPIRLRPDGTFSLRFALPDGTWIIPVRAINADGDQERTITPIVEKHTE